MLLKTFINSKNTYVILEKVKHFCVLYFFLTSDLGLT